MCTDVDGSYINPGCYIGCCIRKVCLGGGCEKWRAVVAVERDCRAVSTWGSARLQAVARHTTSSQHPVNGQLPASSRCALGSFHLKGGPWQKRWRIMQPASLRSGRRTTTMSSQSSEIQGRALPCKNYHSHIKMFQCNPYCIRPEDFFVFLASSSYNPQNAVHPFGPISPKFNKSCKESCRFFEISNTSLPLSNWMKHVSLPTSTFLRLFTQSSPGSNQGYHHSKKHS